MQSSARFGGELPNEPGVCLGIGLPDVKWQAIATQLGQTWSETSWPAAFVAMGCAEGAAFFRGSAQHSFFAQQLLYGCLSIFEAMQKCREWCGGGRDYNDKQQCHRDSIHGHSGFYDPPTAEAIVICIFLRRMAEK